MAKIHETETDIAEFDADSGGAPDDIFLSSAQVMRRYGNITDMTLWRWLQDPKMRFPQPIYLGRLRYWKLRDLAKWERERDAYRPKQLAMNA